MNTESSSQFICSVSPATRRHLRLSRWLIVALTVALFAVLATGAAPCAWWGDGLELACAAWTLGIPHPTGYPLYMLLGHGWMKLLTGLGAVGDPGQALTLFSTLMIALATGSLVLWAHRLLLDDPARVGGAAACDCGMAALLPAVGAGLLSGLTWTARDHATFAEVYPLTLALGVALVHLSWRGTVRGAATWRAGALLGGVTGLALLNHYSVLALVPLVVLTLVAWARAAAREQGAQAAWRIVGAAVLAGAIALLGYLYLPLRAAANPPLNWGDPRTLERLLWVLRGGQFSELKIGTGDGAALRGLLRWVRWWGVQWLPLAWQGGGLVWPLVLLQLGVIITGLLRLTRRAWALGWGLLTSLLATALFGALYQIPDIDAYFMIALPAAATGWLVAVQWGLAALRRREPGLLRGPLARALPAVAGLALLLAHHRAVDKSWDDAALVWGEAALRTAPSDALILTQGDSDIYALWYQQMVREQRPDVSIVGSQFIFSGWYARYFEHPSRPRVAVQITDRAPGHKLDFDVALFGGTLLPNLAAGRPVLTTFVDPLFAEYLQPRAGSGALLPESYYEETSYPYGLPGPQLIVLTPNPQLAAMDAQALKAELMRNYQRQAGARQGRP